jgi:hypothetical protein
MGEKLPGNTFSYVMADAAELQQVEQLVKAGGNTAIVALATEDEAMEARLPVVTLPAGARTEEAALKILDKLLTLNGSAVHIADAMSTVNFD